MWQVQLTAGCISFYQKLPFGLFSSFSNSFSHPHCVHGVCVRACTGKKNITVNDHHMVFSFDPQNRNTQWGSHLSCQNIWLANISKHQLQMSICTVTQTMKWLHVAAGQQPTLRKWSSGWRSISKFSFLSSTSDSCKTKSPCGDNEITFFFGFSTFSSWKLETEHAHKPNLMLKISHS